MSITAALIAGGASLLGGKMSNVANAKEAAKNRAFQEDMSNTSWQRGVADMKAAGLSPMLAYNKGGAAVPSGSQAQQSDVVTPAVNTALSALQNKANVHLTEANAAKTEAETDNVEKAGRLIESQIAQNANSAAFTAGQTKQLDLVAQKLQSEIDLNLANRNNASVNYNKLLYEANNLQRKLDLDNQQMEAAIAYLKAKTGIVDYSLVGARNEARLNDTWYGRNVRPILPDIGSVLNSAKRFRSLGGD